MSRLAVWQDKYGQAIFAECVAQIGTLAALIGDLPTDEPYDLLSDTFAQCYQAVPNLRPAAEMDLSHLWNHAVATALSTSRELAGLRTVTRHDKYASAFACLSLAERLRTLCHSALDSAVEVAQTAVDSLDLAVAEATMTTCTFAAAVVSHEARIDGLQGPLTVEQTASSECREHARMSMQQANELAERAALVAEAAVQRARDEAASVTESLRPTVAASLRQAREALAAEAELFAAWGVSPGEMTTMDFAERQCRAGELRGHRLSRFVKELGRWRSVASAAKAHKVPSGRDEVYDTELSGRLPDVMASEFAMLGTPIGQVDFVVRLTERRLLSKRYRGSERVGRGAIIVLTDTSYSMQKADEAGITRECWAKGLSLALLEQARAERRDFVGIIFSSASEQEVFTFTRGQATLDEVLAYTTRAFNGGTEFAKPIDMAIEILERQFNQDGRAKGDIVLVTDDECRLTKQWCAAYAAHKDRLSFRMYGITVGSNSSDGPLSQIADDHRSITSFTDPSTAAGDVVRAV